MKKKLVGYINLYLGKYSEKYQHYSGTLDKTKKDAELNIDKGESNHFGKKHFLGEVFIEIPEREKREGESK